MKTVLFLFFAALPLVGQTFSDQQKQYTRVKAACMEKDSSLNALFRSKGIPYPPKQLFFRAFKKDACFEVWAENPETKRFVLVKQYAICAPSGDLGPKRQEGDLQVPEGFYSITVFNHRSAYHLSLGINYPNASDRILGNKRMLGDAIMIHGACVTIGCIPLTDSGIKEVYWLSVLARSNGQEHIPVHIFPTRLNEDGMALLKKEYTSDTVKIHFWKNLQKGFFLFEQSRRVSVIGVAKNGSYY